MSGTRFDTLMKKCDFVFLVCSVRYGQGYYGLIGPPEFCIFMQNELTGGDNDWAAADLETLCESWFPGVSVNKPQDALAELSTKLDAMAPQEWGQVNDLLHIFTPTLVRFSDVRDKASSFREFAENHHPHYFAD